MENRSVRFKVSRYSYAKKAGKAAVFKVHFESKDGETLVLVSGSKEIYEGFPEGETFDVRIGKAQKTLDETPEGP